ncbi:DEAD/DEAH box helicase [Caulobacter sp. 73W]|uniref:Transcription-repair-coupling factor n=1 Tax=Caulobacter sp. 73W TaxID=3161137 RepID=A0AB39KXS8_9CAUL
MPQARKSEPAVAGEILTPGAAPPEVKTPASAQPPCSAIAAELSARSRKTATQVHVASSERRAEEIARALRGFTPQAQVLVLPPWDCLPYDRASPSRDIMGRRMAVLEILATTTAKDRVVIVSPEALIQRLAPNSALEDAFVLLRVGQAIDRAQLTQYCRRVGYVTDDRIDEPGEVAILGSVVDIFPADAALPVRLRLGEGDVIEEISPYDPLSQRTIDTLADLRVGPASEWIEPSQSPQETKEADAGEPRPAGREHGLAQHYGALQTLFDLIPKAQYSLDPKARQRLEEADRHVSEAFEARRALATSQTASPPEGLYLGQDELEAGFEHWTGPQAVAARLEPLPPLGGRRNASKALGAFVVQAREAGRRVVIGGLEHEVKLMARALQRGPGLIARPIADWAQALAAAPGELMSLNVDADAGFIDAQAGLVLICASDVFGGRLAARQGGSASALELEQELQLGDVVLHEDHGLGVLRDVRTIDVDGAPRDTVQLEYKGGDSLLAPIEEIGRIWRYGAEASAVALDRLKGDAWPKRRAEASAQIDEAAASLVALAKEKAGRTCDAIEPPRAAFDRFASRFPYPVTEDQARAIDDVLVDLRSGRPMDRLICADVGYGKTEVALRAAAAVALSGRQVMLAAPTTVLARQHFEVFKRRFADFGVGVAQLSRLVSPGQAKAVREGLASGEISVVIGTHALGGADVRFDALGLVIIDEEQKFGAALKEQLRALAGGGHILTLTATPIPRTMQAAIVGLQAVSLIATPPARRRPVRTFLAPFDIANLRTALYRERRRGGQSFIVAPRIEDLDPLRTLLDRHAPDLSVRVAHGGMAAEAVDDEMLAFADGDGDVLLATNIIESGLDVPRANTMVIWRPDRFGLSQLHQLRGRVGRGRTQGVAYLLTDDREPISDAARSRLSTLEAFDRLGSGIAISARDLDLRGGGDLVGDDQAGHMKLIGSALYQKLMERAVRQARGEVIEDEWSPQIRLDGPSLIPKSYCPDPVVRLNLYARLARLGEIADIDAFEEELVDRLGPTPPEAQRLLLTARLRTQAARAGVQRLSVGPKGVLLEFRGKPPKGAAKAIRRLHADVETKDQRVVLIGAWDEPQMAALLDRVLEALVPDG